MKIKLPLTDNVIGRLKAGEKVELAGNLFVARDAVHKKFIEMIEKGKPLPVSLKGEVIYYMGPSPAPPGKIIGSCGPTTSSRMDEFTLALLPFGLKGTMGKGKRSKKIVKVCKKYRSIYLVTFGGCGAYLSKFVKKISLVAYPELGPEALFQIEVEDFPAIVGIDIYGNDIYEKV